MTVFRSQISMLDPSPAGALPATPARTRRGVGLALLTLSLASAWLAHAQDYAPPHPFLIVRETDYPALRARSARWPWSVMKDKALEAARTIPPSAGASFYQKTLLVYNLGTACALARILEPSQAAAFAGVVGRVIRPLLHDIRLQKEAAADQDGYELMVPASNAAFMTYLLLDILYNDLAPDDRRALEDDCDYIADHQRPPWFESKYAIEGLRELYHHGVSAEFRHRAGLYRDYLMNATTDDGVYMTGPGYAHSRLYMEERVQKKNFMDVCEFQGIHEFYSEPRLQHLYEWLFGYSVTPFNRTYTFGDTSPTKFFEEISPAALRVGRFSRMAQGYAFWHLGSPEDDRWKGGLLQYLFCDSTVFSPQQPVSRIFTNGGAWLLQKEYGPQALAGVLWNVNTVHESHSHYDANSINIAAFGELILRNSGYDNWREPDSVTWEWIHRTAESSNTLTVGDANHADFRGGGITEGILGPEIEYASGRSGASLATAGHERSLVLVHPEKDLHGYFLLFDEVQARAGATPVHLMLHPNAIDPPAVARDGQEYDWKVKGCVTASPPHARIVLAERPAELELKRGYLGAVDSCNRFVGSYLRATYRTNPEGVLRLATVIYPYGSGSAPPGCIHFSSAGARGVSIAVADSVTDVVLTADPDSESAVRGVSLQAAVAYWREVRSRAWRLFVRNGRKFLAGLGPSFGFESAKPVSMVMTAGHADVVSPGTTVVFYLPGRAGAALDGARVVHARPGERCVRIPIPAGNHHLEFR